MDYSDSALLCAIRRGDVEALACYIEVHRERLLAYVQTRMSEALRRKIDPDDILQDVCAYAIRSFSQIEFDERKPFSWLCRLAERRIVDAHRYYFMSEKRAARRETPIRSPDSDHSSPRGLIDLLQSSITTPSAVFSRDQRQMRLRLALAKLPSQQRQIIRMRYGEGIPSKDIAAKLGKSNGAVRVMLTRSLRTLKELLGPEAAPR